MSPLERKPMIAKQITDVRTLRPFHAQVRTEDAHLACALMDNDRALAHLGTAARRLRKQAGIKLVRIGAALDKSEASLSRFESGRVQPDHLDETVRVYAEELEITPLDLWEAALEDWRKNGSS